MSTPYHSQYWAHALTLKGSSDSLDNLSRSISNACVDLNPHQVDAALFAVRSPLSRGVILADEVGLGKTIEAGIVIAQKWAEWRRRVLVVLPATLRKQWLQEMEEKFHLPGVVLEARAYRRLQGNGGNPFDQKGRLVLCSYHFAAAKAPDIKRIEWDLVIMDEAHRLRNVYKPNNKMAQAITEALRHAPKLLLTATPLQNSLMELYGLVSVVDPHVFGSAQSFRDQFLHAASEVQRNEILRQRLAAVCTRTLRKQVQEYVRFTRRTPITQEFLPTDPEHRLYEDVSAYLQRETLVALPSSQRMLMTMVVRKLLASSSFAIAATLRQLIKRLEGLLNDDEPLGGDFETLDELEDEWDGDGEATAAIDPVILAKEIADLRSYAHLAESIEHNAKGDALLGALETAFQRAEDLGAQRKAVVFTESRRTQTYLHGLLTANGYEGQIVCLNGTNTDPPSGRVYQGWLERHANDGRPTGSRAVDVKAAIIEEFRERATVLIATEAAAEGVNLQFCSLVVNYDLPWNPQRIEQRIGRCHRYGQKHDVVVVNFLNKRNAADQRVYELLSEKFRLFDGVFGASDEVLGALESGVDIERRIAAVYQTCRDEWEIRAAFDAIQEELNEQIQSRLAQTRQALLDNFDEEVQSRLQVHRDQALATLSERQQWLLSLTRTELADKAWFDAARPRFRFQRPEDPSARLYNLDWKDAEQCGEVFYRTDHSLAEDLIQQAQKRHLLPAVLKFSYTASGARLSPLEPLVGQAGWLRVSKLSVNSLELEEFLLLSGVTDSGHALDPDVTAMLFRLSADVQSTHHVAAPPAALAPHTAALEKRELAAIERRNASFVDQEVEKLDRWADDLKFGLEREIKDLDKRIKEVRRETREAISLTEKLATQKHVRTIEAQRNRKRRELYDAQDHIDGQRDDLIEQIERQLRQTHKRSPLFTVRWTIT